MPEGAGDGGADRAAGESLERVAVPLFGADVAPWFCHAHEVLVADLTAGGFGREARVELEGISSPERLRRLAGRGVEVLLCGGFTARLVPLARALGIVVLWGLRGEVSEVLAWYASNRLEGRGDQTAGPGRHWRRGMSTTTTVAVAADDDRGLDSQVCAHFGSCPSFVLVEVAEDRITGARVVPNPNAARHQPGGMPRYIHGLGAHVMLAGGMGPRAVDLFASLGIEAVTGAVGTVRETVERYLAGSLRGSAPCEHGHGEQGGCADHDARPEGALVALSVRGPGRGLEADLDPRFGRAERFLLVDGASGRVVEELVNVATGEAHGAGPAAAQLVAARGASVVVSGRFGPNAVRALAGLGVATVEVPDGTPLAAAVDRGRAAAGARR